MQSRLPRHSRGILPARTAIVAPHLDDGVLSLGAAIFHATRAAAYVRVVTVFAGDPESDRPASGWDSLPGFGTEGEATRQRREEDAEACGVLGAERHYLHFSEPVYAGFPDPDAVVADVNEALRNVDAVLVPGFPLIHRDHRWLAELLLSAELDVSLVGLYVEQPYRHQNARYRRLQVDSSLRTRIGDRLSWRRLGMRRQAIRAKRRAITAYASQLRWLELDGAGLDRMLTLEALRGGERVAWLGGRESSVRRR